MKFEDCIGFVLKWEGGYSNHPEDPGGETKFGIAKKFYPKLDIKNLTREEAIAIYKRDYWDKNNMAEIPIYLRLAYFDCVVNQGAGAAVKILQRALGVTPDMIFGPKTRQALLNEGVGVVQKFLSERMLHYTRLHHFDTFGRGWTKRLIDVTLESGRFLGTWGQKKTIS